MANKKVYRKLPAVLQTTAVKNFFENTVEQLFSKANAETVQGFIGSPSSEDVGVEGSYLREPTVTKRFYGLTPGINTINSVTGKSEDFIFYDELIDTLKTYGVNTKDHNKLFSENYTTYLPPIDVDKLINYQEYYWAPQGPSTIVIEGTAEQPIDIDRDILGQQTFTAPTGLAFRSGMIVRFEGDYVIPQSKLFTEFIVEGVGDSIFFSLKNDNFSTRFATTLDGEYDPDAGTGDGNIYHSSATLSSVVVNNPGVGYINPQIIVYDDARSSEPALLSLYPSLVVYDGLTAGNVVPLEAVANVETVNNTLSELANVQAIYDTYRVGNLATLTANVNSLGEISDIIIDDGGENYTGDIKIGLYFDTVQNDANTSAFVPSNISASNSTISTATIEMDTVTDVLPGQLVSGYISGIVQSVVQEDVPQGITPKIILTEIVQFDLNAFAASPTLTFSGSGFDAEVRLDDMHQFTSSSVVINNTQARVGVNPNNVNDYYLLGGANGWDADATGDGLGDANWGGTLSQSEKDYFLQQRGATNRNVWSRVNFWYHRDNFLDAGDQLPNRSSRADRPIIEFDRTLELYNFGSGSIGSVIAAASDSVYASIDGAGSGLTIDSVPAPNSTFIFPTESTAIAQYVYTAQITLEDEGVQVNVLDLSNTVANTATVSFSLTKINEDDRGFGIANISVTDGGLGYQAPVGAQIDLNRFASTSTRTTEIPLIDTSAAFVGQQVTGALEGFVASVDGANSNIVLEAEVVINKAEFPSTAIELSNTVIQITSNDGRYGAGAFAIPSVDANGTITAVTVSDPGNGYYQFTTLRVDRVGDPVLNPANSLDGDPDFVPLQVNAGDTVQILSGEIGVGKEYTWNGAEWVLNQEKLAINQEPLFNLYDSEGNYLGDESVYPENDFQGSKIFSYAREIPATDNTGIVKSPINDSELGFPLVFKQFKASSEIVFENYQYTETYHYTPATTSDQVDIDGYYFYKLDKETPEFNSYWRVVDQPSAQRIYTTYSIPQADVDRQKRTYFIGCVPETNVNLNSGYDIRVKVNGKERIDFTYGNTLPGHIDFDKANLAAGDFVEISAYSSDGLISINSISKFELPLSWDHNVTNLELPYASEPEYLPHFLRYIETQDLFEGEPLGPSNFNSIPHDIAKATNIIQTGQDVLLGSFLLDDQPHNLIDAMRFNAQEYTKYRNRVRSEINKYFQSNYVESATIESQLEQVLRNVITYKIGRDVFNRTYIIPFGDNFIEESFLVAVGQTNFTLSNFLNLSKLENSLLVYRNDELQVVDKDYVFVSFSPEIEISFISEIDTGDTIVTKLYNDERDSAQCPPTPSTMGLYPLFLPEITVDDTFQTPVEVIVGHDGSRTATQGDIRDTLLLEFEKRIYIAAKREFREANSLPEYNVSIVRGGAFRDTGFGYQEWHDLMSHYFAIWTTANKVDPTTNEFFDESNKFTWNYSNTDEPGYWRGIYEYYYDTVRPNTHPWEMLGFTEKPLWWDEQYAQFEQDDIGRNVPFISYASTNTTMWDDIEKGIIRQGPRENVENDRYLVNNPFKRIGLKRVLPVDENANLISPHDLIDTSTTTRIRDWDNSLTVDQDDQFYYRTASFGNVAASGVNVSWDDTLFYVTGEGIPGTIPGAETLNESGVMVLDGNAVVEQPVSYAIPRRNLLNPTAGNPLSPEVKMPVNGAIGVLLNGLPLYNLDIGRSWNDEGTWFYDTVLIERQISVVDGHSDTGLVHYHTIPPAVVGLDEWDTSNASPMVGWAFDGLPIYGPYGYSDYNDENSEVIRIRSPWVLRSGTRIDGPGGAYTGEFIQDYQLDAVLEGNTGYTNRYNLRYAKTVDSLTAPIWHYVVTEDENGVPEFPYAVGGGVNNQLWLGAYYSEAIPTGQIASVTVIDAGGLYTQSNTSVVITGDGTGATANVVVENGSIASVIITNAGSNYTTASAEIIGDGVRAEVTVQLDTSNNGNSNATVNADATVAVISTENLVQEFTPEIQNQWKFSDGAPVETAWKYSENYPYAVAEALLLAKPGRFATIFSDPTKLYRPTIDERLLFNRNTKKRWQFLDPDQFEIHGDFDADGNFITNIGYTQFVNSWLKFQGLDVASNFIDKLRSLNIKLAHRMSGYIDKDTMIARTDQYSNDGNATSLIIPQENIGVTLHSSPYKSRNYYSGVIVEQTAGGYRVRGFDRSRGYFETLESDTAGRRENVEIGGTPVSFVTWEPNKTYNKNIIVEHLGGYYQAPITISSGAEFVRTDWTRLPALPMINAASAPLYRDTTGAIKRVNYETVFSTKEEVFDFLVSLGRYQTGLGFDFGEYDSAINAVRDWDYAAKQFLFWTTGKWEIGNTIELSPFAQKAKFVAPRGFIAKINRVEREQFTIKDQNGAVISPTDCEIIREDDYIEITPPPGVQIYGIMLFVKEMEHVVSFDNTTEFNDVIFDSLLTQRHSRIKLKAKRTKNWTGKFSSEGFIIDGEELKPNLDNLAESMGRYHELGFIPVEKQIYETARSLFGYTEREYLTELDVTDDQQFEFYKGILQSKGTNLSLSRIARSSAIVQGNVTVFDEWALKAGDFGDLDNSQSIELQLNQSDIKQNPQLVTLGFPEDVTNIVERIDVLDARYTYSVAPTIEISQPLAGGEQATAVSTLDVNGMIDYITVTNPGSGYPEAAAARVIASDVEINNVAEILGYAVATRNGYMNLDQTSLSLTLRDNLTSNANIVISVSGVGNANVTASQVVDAINTDANVNVNITARAVESHYVSGGNAVLDYSLVLAGADFTVIEGANVGLEDVGTVGEANASYQPQQRFGIITALDNGSYTTDENDITVTVNGENLANVENNVTVWTYDAGSLITVIPDANYPRANTSATLPEGNIVYPLTNNSATFAFTGSDNIATENLEIDETGAYKFVEVYINDVLIVNTADTYNWYDTDGNINTPGVSLEVASGQKYVLTETGIIFPDISLLPNEALTALLNPPRTTTNGIVPTPDQNGKQSELYYSLTPATPIRIVESATVQFTDDYQGDLPNSKVNFRVVSDEGIATRIVARRNYEITEDAQNNDVLFIDIDNTNKFLKRPTGVRENNLWKTTTLVNATGIVDPAYPSVRNSGYVDSKHVNFQAFDLASMSDLFSDDLLVKPTISNLIHVANDEREDWNVYRINPIAAEKSFLYRNARGLVHLYTDYSLFNYLDTNQIGEPNTGRYLDYYLVLKNAPVSDELVVWRNEDIVTTEQTSLSDIEAPRMIEARIASIGPADLIPISNVEPALGRTISGLRLDPIAGSNTVLVTGPAIGNMRDGDAVQLIDNVGDVNAYLSDIDSSTANTFVLNSTYVSEITLTAAGNGYTQVPTVTVAAPPSGETANAVAKISGNIANVIVTDTGDFTTASVELVDPTGSNAEFNVDIVNGVINAIEITNPGYGYTSAPNVTITGAATAVVANVDIEEGSGRLLRIRVENPGSGYTASSPPTVTISGGGGSNATAIAQIIGNVEVTVTNAGDGFTEVPAMTITGDGTSAAANVELNATLTGITVSDFGYGYTSVPAVTVDPSTNGANATATAVINRGVTEANTQFTAYGTGNVYITLAGEMSPVLESQALANINALTVSEKATYDSIKRILNKKHAVTAIDAANGLLTINSTDFTSDVASNLINTGYRITTYRDYTPLVGTYYTVRNVTSQSFEITRPDTDFSQRVMALHLNKTKITTSQDHGFSSGDIFRVNTNNFRGMYTASSTTANTIIIDAPWIQGFDSGNLIKQGIKITTTSPHGISPFYAENGKRIAVHFATPLYYNKVYSIDAISPDTIIIGGHWPKTDDTHVYYEERIATLNGSVPYEAGNINADAANATNVINITDNVKLNQYLATYDSNNSVVPARFVSFGSNVAIIAPEGLPSDTSISVGVTLIRQEFRNSNRYPVLTTLDHNRVVMNGSTIDVDSYNNLAGLNRSLNRQIELRRAFSTTQAQGFSLKFGMVKDPNVPVAINALGQGLTAAQVGNYGPYLRDPNLIERLSGNQLDASNTLDISDNNEKVVDTDFNKGTISVGPTKGLEYTDINSGIVYRWSSALQQYRAVNNTDGNTVVSYGSVTGSQPPEFHTEFVDGPEAPAWVATTAAEIAASSNPNTDVAYAQGEVIIYQDQYYIAKANVVLSNNTLFANSNFWSNIQGSDEVSTLINENLLLTRIPGTGTGYPTAPGSKRKDYNMLSTTSFNSGAVVIPTFRLLPNNYNVFEIYQAVQNTNDNIYYILIDKSSPPNEPHNFFGTVNKYSDFLGYSTTSYYYINNIIPDVDGSNKITNSKDPIALENIGYVLELPPVEPATYIGKQTVPEPFAQLSGNGTTATANFESLPELLVGSNVPGGKVSVAANESGYNQFLMWTPGLEPGKWQPTATGPGLLPGRNGGNALAGFGRGYYEANDVHLNTDYPITSSISYDKPIPRFLYSKKFSVFPPVSNQNFIIYLDPNGNNYSEDDYLDALEQNETLGGFELDTLVATTISPQYVSEGDENTANEGLRPEEIFVACFWTEPYTYKNQLVGFNFNNLDANGLPAPIYKDYAGTVTRFKYIRLTELPKNAITRRLIPDTGWGGKGWNNRRIDDIDLTSPDNDNVWSIFEPSNVAGGSTGNENENIVESSILAVGTEPVDGAAVTRAGELRTDISQVDTIPITEIGPIINAAALEGLPGPCVSVAAPGDQGSVTQIGCGSKDKETVASVLNRDNVEPLRVNGAIVPGAYFVTVKIVGNEPVQVFFDSRSLNKGIAVSLTQNSEPYPNAAADELDTEFAWFEDNVLRIDTKSNGGSGFDDGSQIGIYGTSEIIDGQFEDPGVQGQLGITVPGAWTPAEFIKGNDDLTDPVTIDGDWLPFYADNDELAAKGVGFIQRRLDCNRGEYVTLFIREDVADATSGDWLILFRYTQEKVEFVEEEPTNTCPDEILNAPSRAYANGAIWREWRNTRDLRIGYFGQPEEGERYDTSSGDLIDNIWFPYQAIPNTITRRTFDPSLVANTRQGICWGNNIKQNSQVRTLRKSAASSGNQQLTPRTVVSLPGKQDINPGTTIEIKGYFRAPHTGFYTFYGVGDDGLWLWLSSAFDREEGTTNYNRKQYRIGKDDLSGDEYFKEDGYQVKETTFNAYMNSKNYHRDNYVLRTGWRTTDSNLRNETSHVTVFLEEGKYYFTRLIAGNYKRRGQFDVAWNCRAGESANAVAENFSSGFTGDFSGIQVFSGRLTFSGRYCEVEDNAPASSEDNAPADTSDASRSGSTSSYEACLERVGWEPTLSLGGFSLDDTQLRCWYHAYGTCFPGAESRCQALGLGINEEVDTPVTNPAPGDDPANDPEAVSSSDIVDRIANPTAGNVPTSDEIQQAIDDGILLVQPDGTLRTSTPRQGAGGGQATDYRRTGVRAYSNFSGYSQREMTGYNFFPSSFKKAPRVVVDPQRFGYKQDIPEGRFVSATQQRISGGYIVPLAKPLTVVNRQPTPLINMQNNLQPWSSNLQDLTNLNQTEVRYNPKRIGGTFVINGVEVSNTTNNGFSNNEYTGPAFEEPSIDQPTSIVTQEVLTPQYSTALEPTEFTRFDNRNIRFTRVPVVNITPLSVDQNGNYFNAGPTAKAQIFKPTPSIKISQQDLLKVNDGEELIINGKKIIVRGLDLNDLKTQINCASLGVTAQTVPGPGLREDLLISSCSGAPWTAANGCGSGTYKQVGDFHINRGFDQTKNVTRSYNDTVFYPLARASVTSSASSSGSSSSSQSTSGTQPASGPQTFTRYEYDTASNNYVRPSTVSAGNPDSATLSTPAIAPLENISETTSTSLGGSGYRVGDRLRLIGGTPVNNPKAPLTKICIDSAGSGFTNPANLQVVINGNGSSPGIGAAAVVTELDENGGIAGIEMVNYGGAYDINNPPQIEIYDSTPTNVNVTTISSAWPEQISVSSNDIIRVEYTREVRDPNDNAYGQIVVRNRFMRATAPVSFGADANVVLSKANISYVNPANEVISTAPRVAIEIDTASELDGYVRPNSFVNLEFYPQSVLDDNETTANANVTTSQATIELTSTTGISQGDAISKVVSNVVTLVGIVNTVNATNVVLTANTTENITQGETIYFGSPINNLFWIPEPTDSDTTVFTNKFYIEDSAFSSQAAVNYLFGTGGPITVTARKPWWKDLVPDNINDRPRLVDTINPDIPKIPPKLSAKIGIRPDLTDTIDPQNANDSAFLDGYKGMAGPLRVAKFIVTSVDEAGAIVSLKIIDRGLYKVFPSDLTFGIPLEYDYEIQGSGSVLQSGDGTVSPSQRAHQLGVVDPSRNNIQYGPFHPEYQGFPFEGALQYLNRIREINEANGKADSPVGRMISAVGVKVDQGVALTENEQGLWNEFLRQLSAIVHRNSSKHPDWTGYPEFYYDGKNYVPYSGSPGAYDPSTYVVVDTSGLITDPTVQVTDNLMTEDDIAFAVRDGRMLRKTLVIDRETNSQTFGQYIRPDAVAGGTGARVFLTAQEVPNCSSRGTAKEALGIPDVVTEINAPESFVAQLNAALENVGYDPEEIRITVDPLGDIGVIEISTPFPGINIDSPTPGFLEKFGLPTGDYNIGMLCIEGILNDPNLTNDEAAAIVNELYDSGEFGVIDEQRISEITGRPLESLEPTRILNLLCVTRLGPGRRSRFPAQPFPDYPAPLNDNNSIFGDGKVDIINELYKYEVTNIFGNSLALTNESKRQNVNVGVLESMRFNDLNVPIDPLTAGDDEIGTSTLDGLANAWVDNYNNQGWAYLENGTVIRQQEPLVDSNFVNNAMMYDSETGEKIADLQLWDPFKGVLPGFIKNEVHYISDTDPVSYNNARTRFGSSQVGKVWWDTSTVRYTWYEQGTNQERWRNWGKAFPGSTITVCEWVESKALPSNWTGSGTPRWQQSYVTERRQDPKTGEYTLYYYYWVQNRNIVDDRVTRDLGRKIDTQTLAKYIANPRGYGLDIISFISDESFTLTNVSDDIKDRDVNLQINISRNLNPNGLDHTAWKLLREGDDNSIIPDHLSDKLIDSLCSENAIGQEVPDTNLSEVERYGIAFRPRQTMFRNVKEARRVMTSVLNRILSDIKLQTQFPQWDVSLPTDRTYIQTVNWFAVDRVDSVTKEKIRFNESYKPVLSVSSVSELRKLKDLPDGTVVQISSSQNNVSQLWLYVASQNAFKQISVKNNTIKLRDITYTDDTNAILSNELRLLLTSLRDNVFVNTSYWNTLFFELLKYAYMEQQQLSWAFKTSYLYVEKEEDDLVQFTGFKPDNFQKVLDYLNEVKPYTAKIREYKDGKRSPIDLIGQNNISDYDNPPYADPVTGNVRILDETVESDLNIMGNSSFYVDYWTAYTTGNTDPVRKANTTLTFDRTNWQLTQFNWDPVTVPVNLSIARNIANLTQMTSSQIYADETLRAIDRIFKFDPQVQATFIAEVNTYFNDVTASSNADIVGNTDAMYEIVEAGELDRTLKLVRELVGGGWRGEEIDSKKFSALIEEVDYINTVITQFGFDTTPWDDNTDNDNVMLTSGSENYGNVTTIGIGDHPWDSTVELVNYEGVFNTETQGNVTLRRNDTEYSGFDGVTFQRVLYGEDRPEELALIDPLESVIMTVTTSNYAYGNANAAANIVAPFSAEVTYRIHQSLFGETDYLRISNNASTELAANAFTYSDELTLVDVRFLPQPTLEEPGMVWVGSERINYTRRDGNVLSGLIRGAAGTSIQDHPAGTPVNSAESSEYFNFLNPQANVWLDTGVRYSNESKWDEAVDNTPGNPNDNDYTLVQLWDELAANGTVTYSNSTIISGNLTVSVIEIAGNTTNLIQAGEVANIANVSSGNSDIVSVDSITYDANSNISTLIVVPEVGANLDTSIFVAGYEADVTTFLYGEQTNDDKWDAGTVTGQTALSLSDRSNADYSKTYSIMTFLHGIQGSE